MRENLGFHGKVEWTLRDADGNIKDHGVHYNQIQDYLLEEVIDGLDAGSCDSIGSMSIGTGTGQSWTDDALASVSSHETTANTQSGTPEDDVECTSTFTNVAAAITEAGLFKVGGKMFAYDDTLSVTLTTSDSLQIDWTISAASA